MKRETNIPFCLLSVLGIIFVVDGHLNHSFFDIGGLIPYYAFHMPLFVFISGYFFRMDEGESLWGFAERKFVRLMIPYYFWNLVYGLLAAFLRRNGFLFGEPVTFNTMFLEPFRLGYQFILNHAAWFVPSLFLVELVYRALSSWKFCKNKGKSVWSLFWLTFAGGICGIIMSRAAGNEGFFLTAEKMLFLLPFYSAGVLYRRELEAKDRLGNGLYFSVILGVAVVLWLSGKPLIYSVSTCRDFSGCLLPYITGFLGIAFWLRVSKILAPAFRSSRFLEFFGRNTFSIMMHHMMVFFLLTTCFAFGAKYMGMFGDFDYARYKSDIYYCYRPGGEAQWIIIYLLAGLMVPLGFQKILMIFRGKVKITYFNQIRQWIHEKKTGIIRQEPYNVSDSGESGRDKALNMKTDQQKEKSEVK